MQLPVSDVRAWYLHIDQITGSGSRLASCLGYLTPEERERYERYRLDSDRVMFLAGRAMARELVGRAAGVAPLEWEWREGPHGRPEVHTPEIPIRFNLAHSAGLVVCGLAHGRDVGVDVEDLQRPRVSYGLVDRYCSPREIADIDAAGEDGWHDRFLLYWTLKEAFLKALGLGISVPLRDVSFVINDGTARVEFLDSLAGNDDRWAFDLSRPTSRHLLAVAASTADGVRPQIHVAPMPLAWLP